MSIEAMRQALEALEIVVVDVKTTPTAYEAHRQAIAALRAAIEAAEKPAAVSDAAIEAWAERHDIQGTATDLRCMFEDAASFTAAPVLEPVAWREFDGEGGYTYSDYQYNETWRDAYIKRNGEKYANWVEPLYTAAPAAQRTWVGLTDKEILSDDTLRYYYGLNGGSGPVSQKGKKVIAAIEAKLKEKNHD